MKELTKEQEQKLKWRVDGLWHTCNWLQEIIAIKTTEYAKAGIFEAKTMASFLSACSDLLNTSQIEYDDAQKEYDLRT